MGRKQTELVKKTCGLCHKPFVVRATKKQLKKKYCSKHCAALAFKKTKRELRKQFRAGLTPENKFAEMLNEQQIKFIPQVPVVINNRKHVFDFWLEDFQAFVEIDGDFYHYNCRNKTVAKKAPNRRQKERMKRDDQKNKFCQDNNIRLIRIWTSELEEKGPSILNRLKVRK